MLADLADADLDLDRTRYQEAIGIYLRWLPEIMRNGWLSVEAKIRINLGVAYQALGDRENAMLHQTRALEIFRSLGDEDGIAKSLLDLAPLLRGFGDLSAAKAGLDEALLLSCRLGDTALTSQVLAQLAITSAAQGNLQDGLKQIGQALSLATNPDERAKWLTLVASLSWQAGDYVAAIENASLVSQMGSELKDVRFIFAGESLLAISLVMKGQLEAAYAHLINAIDLAELQGLSVTVSELKASFMSQLFDLYSAAVVLGAETGQPAEAFHHVEQAKARALLDQLAQAQPASSGFSSDLIEPMRELPVQKMKVIEQIREETRKPLLQQNSVLLSDLNKRLEEIESKQADLLVRLKVANPSTANLEGAGALRISDVQRNVSDGAAIVEFFITEKEILSQRGEGAIYVWVIRKKDFKFIQLPMTAGEIARKVIFLRRAVETREDFQPVATELYRDLFAPLEPYIRVHSLIIIPHGVLHQLPFAVLWNPGRKRYLLDDYEISYAPSASVLSFIYGRGPTKNQGILVLGDPDGTLPHAAEEARAVAHLYGVKPLLGRDATESAVLASGPIGILHLAAHGIYDSASPLFSRVELAPEGWDDGRLEMHEILGSKLRGTSLVVLSGCRTQADEATVGDELVGLPRAFLLAGARSVVSSLWNVDDQSTAYLMKRFYIHLRRGLGKAESLRRAQRETRARFPHPYDWAAFSLVGVPD